MTATRTPAPAGHIHRPHRRRCALCQDTGIVKTYEPKFVGHASNGEAVFNPRVLVLVQRFCECRKGRAA